MIRHLFIPTSYRHIAQSSLTAEVELKGSDPGTTHMATEAGTPPSLLSPDRTPWEAQYVSGPWRHPVALLPSTLGPCQALRVLETHSSPTVVFIAPPKAQDCLLCPQSCPWAVGLVYSHSPVPKEMSMPRPCAVAWGSPICPSFINVWTKHTHQDWSHTSGWTHWKVHCSSYLSFFFFCSCCWKLSHQKGTTKTLQKCDSWAAHQRQKLWRNPTASTTGQAFFPPAEAWVSGLWRFLVLWWLTLESLIQTHIHWT